MYLEQIYNICREFSDSVEVDENQDVLLLINQKYLDEISNRAAKFYWDVEVRRSLHCFHLIKVYPLL